MNIETIELVRLKLGVCFNSGQNSNFDTRNHEATRHLNKCIYIEKRILSLDVYLRRTYTLVNYTTLSSVYSRGAYIPDKCIGTLIKK